MIVKTTPPIGKISDWLNIGVAELCFRFLRGLHVTILDDLGCGKLATWRETFIFDLKAMNGLMILGVVSILCGVGFLILPMLSTPVVKGLAFWHAVFQIDYMQIEVKAGFWGTCTYYRNIPDSIEDFKLPKEKEGWEDDIQIKCTKPKAGYSFRMSSTVPDAAGELSSTQTLFLFWLLFAAIIALASVALSFSPNYYQWKHAAIMALVSSILAFAIFLACVVIFAGLTRETRMTESAKTIPLHAGLQGDTFFPLSATFLLIIGAGLFWTSFRQEFFRLHQLSNRADESEDQNQPNRRTDNPPSLPPLNLSNEGIKRDQHEVKFNESRNGTEITRETQSSQVQTEHEELEESSYDSSDIELEEIKKPYGKPSDADDELETDLQSQYSMFQDGSLGSTSYFHSSDGLPPPPPLQSRYISRFKTKKSS